MPTKLATTIIKEFHIYGRQWSIGTASKINFMAIVAFGRFLGPSITLNDLQRTILDFLNSTSL
ncbi:MAG TPA: hypothetical protein VJ729_12505 [Nitrososphaeraceae archaeon]|nr:hypothetical protein [Nitrososphaeraceae archaeon]